jgi:hypothetical protein
VSLSLHQAIAHRHLIKILNALRAPEGRQRHQLWCALARQAVLPDEVLAHPLVAEVQGAAVVLGEVCHILQCLQGQRHGCDESFAVLGTVPSRCVRCLTQHTVVLAYRPLFGMNTHAALILDKHVWHFNCTCCMQQVAGVRACKAAESCR